MNQDQLSVFQFGEEAYKKFGLTVKDKRELVTLINDTIYRKCAKSSKDRYELLDQRDKILKLIRHDLNTQVAAANEEQEPGRGDEGNITTTGNPLLAGSCADMCPERERYSREYLSLCSKYENVYNAQTGESEIDYNIMIKEYSRSSADQDLPLPNEMRPLSVLYDTMLYLINEVITRIETATAGGLDDDIDFAVGEWYDFIWNRTRSIRKDIIQQRLLLNDSPPPNPANVNVDQYEAMINCMGGVLIIGWFSKKNFYKVKVQF
jgi:hypothetical protein